MQYKRDIRFIINEVKSHLNFKNDEQLANFLGTTQSNIATWKKRDTINYDLIIAKCPEIDANWLLTGKGEMLKESYNTGDNAVVVKEPILAHKKTHKKGIPLIPIHALAGIGVGDMQINENEVEDYYEVPLLERRGAKYLIPVAGNSMYPKYASGDLLACKNLLEINFIQWGKPYVLDTDQGAIVKRLFQDPTDDRFFICKSDNHENYPPFKISKDQIYKIAVVVGVIRLE